jgi:ssRNA-specific RNase YbeY (16S rRNA maturation enzyme)
MHQTVCLDVGEFDVPIYSAQSLYAIEEYVRLLKPFCTCSIVVRETENIRRLHEHFIHEDICTQITTIPASQHAPDTS